MARLLQSHGSSQMGMLVFLRSLMCMLCLLHVQYMETPS